MGLPPSTKKDDTDSNSALSNGKNDAEPTRDFDGNIRSGDGPVPRTPRREAWTARGQLLLNFHDAISRAINSPQMVRKCSQIGEDLRKPSSTSKNRSMAEEYSAEAALIVESKSQRDAAVRNKSLALGLFSFVALRSGRGLSLWMKKIVASKSIGRSYQFESHLRSSASASVIKSNHAMDHHSTELKQPSKLTKLLRLAVDTTVSTAIVVLSGASLFMPRPSAYIEDMAKLPLVKGKSVYAEMVCPPLLDEYRRVLEQYGGRWPVRSTTDPDSEGITQEDDSLNVIRTFVENCSKRSAYEVSETGGSLSTMMELHSGLWYVKAYQEREESADENRFVCCV